MLSSNNILSPASGRPLAMPSLDLVTGLYYLCRVAKDGKGQGRVFSSPAEAIMARDNGEIDVQATITVRFKDAVPPRGWIPPVDEDGTTTWEPGQPFRLETTLGGSCQRHAAGRLPVRQRGNAQEAAGHDRQRSGRALPAVTVAATLTR